MFFAGACMYLISKRLRHHEYLQETLAIHFRDSLSLYLLNNE